MNRAASRVREMVNPYSSAFTRWWCHSAWRMRLRRMTVRSGSAANVPRADASSRYHAALKESAKAYPHATEALMRADRHRPRRWQQFVDSVDLRAIDLLLGFLISVSQSLDASELHDLAFLPERIADDVRISLEGLLSGYLQVASDAMRDIIETELLIRDFASDPDRISTWRKAGEEGRRRYFWPARMRERQAKVLGVPPAEVPGAADYAAHSQLLHVRPPLLFPRSPGPDTLAGLRVIYILDALADIMRHGASAVEALSLLLNTLNRSGPDSEQTLAALTAASDDAIRARAAVEAIERRAADSLPADGHWITMLFESGLVIAFDPDTPRMDTYMIDRTDFRTLHRNISSEHPATFALSPLQDQPSSPVSQWVVGGEAGND